MEKFFNFFEKIANSKFFDNFITFIIILAGIVVGLETSSEIKAQYGTLLHLTDFLILTIFVIEIIINILSEKNKPWRYFYDGWHIFDFTIVALCFLPVFFPDTNTQFLAVFRLARILRLAKIFEKIHNLKLLLVSLMKSLPKMSYVIMLLGLLYYIYGVIGTDLFGKEIEDFNSIFKTMKQLFFITFEGMSGVYTSDEMTELISKNTLPEWLVFVYFMSFLFMSAMIFLNLFIGIITSDMETVKSEDSRGKRPIHKSNHTVILGWSRNIFNIVKELIEANKSEERANIVILSELEKDEMEFQIKNAFPKSFTTKIICLSGSPNELSDLKMTNIWNSKSIIILSDLTNEYSDTMSLKTLIAISNHKESNSLNRYHIVSEMQNKKLIDIAKSITHNTVFFESEDFISRLIAQTCLQPKLSQIYTEIIGFDGSEFYVTPILSNQVNKSYSALLLQYDNSCPIGIIRDKKVIINPESSFILNDNDKIIILAEDDSSIKQTSFNYSIDSNTLKPIKSSNINIKKIVILGSNSKLNQIISEINDYLNSNVEITVITNQTSAVKDFAIYLNTIFPNNSDFNDVNDNTTFKFQNLQVEFILNDIENYQILKKYVNNADHIVLLSYFEYFKNVQTADAITLVTLIHLRNIAIENKSNFSITTEIIDDNNRELINNPDVDDFIISSNIKSSVLAQLSEEYELENVFDALFKSEGSEIYLKKAINYCPINTNVNFATLVKSASMINESAIGFIDSENKIHLNPKKNEIFTITNNDILIVLAEN